MTGLTIRQPQMAALTEAFQVSWLRKEVESLYPAECERMGPRGVAFFVANGFRRAKAHGFCSRDLLSYLALELCFGEGFLEDPRQEWAREALSGSEVGRMDRLRHAAIFRLAGLADAQARVQDADPQYVFNCDAC